MKREGYLVIGVAIIAVLLIFFTYQRAIHPRDTIELPFKEIESYQ